MTRVRHASGLKRDEKDKVVTHVGVFREREREGGGLSGNSCGKSGSERVNGIEIPRESGSAQVGSIATTITFSLVGRRVKPK